MLQVETSRSLINAQEELEAAYDEAVAQVGAIASSFAFGRACS